MDETDSDVVPKLRIVNGCFPPPLANMGSEYQVVIIVKSFQVVVLEMCKNNAQYFGWEWLGHVFSTANELSQMETLIHIRE